MKHIVELIKIFVIAGIVIFSAGIIHAQTVWTGPTATPPNNNVAAPINVSTVTQEKMGIFGSHGFFSLGSGWFSTSTRPTWPPVINGQARLTLAVNGSVGAKEYCDDNGQNCVSLPGLSATPRTYVSPWTASGAAGTTQTFTHNLGTLNYTVTIQMKSNNPSACFAFNDNSYGLHHLFSYEDRQETLVGVYHMAVDAYGCDTMYRVIAQSF